MIPNRKSSQLVGAFAAVLLILTVAASAEIIRIKANYVPLPEPEKLGEQKANEKATAERLDTHDLLYTGKYGPGFEAFVGTVPPPAGVDDALGVW